MCCVHIYEIKRPQGHRVVFGSVFGQIQIMRCTQKIHGCRCSNCTNVKALFTWACTGAVCTINICKAFSMLRAALLKPFGLVRPVFIKLNFSAHNHTYMNRAHRKQLCSMDMVSTSPKAKL